MNIFCGSHWVVLGSDFQCSAQWNMLYWGWNLGLLQEGDVLQSWDLTSLLQNDTDNLKSLKIEAIVVVEWAGHLPSKWLSSIPGIPYGK